MARDAALDAFTKMDASGDKSISVTELCRWVDPHGRLIACDRLGAIDPSSLLKEFTVDELKLHHVQNQEFIAKMKAEQSQKRASRAVPLAARH